MKPIFLDKRSVDRKLLNVSRRAARSGRAILVLALMFVTAGCSVVERFVPIGAAPPPQPLATGFAPTQPPPAAPTTDFFGESPAPQPTYTEFPTYTPEPTQTPWPTYTPLPTYTLPPLYPSPTYPVYEPAPYASPTALFSECCTLRVRNNGKKTYWIGTVLPYGGNYIKPGQYVEFYPHGPAWFRIYWCRFRYTSDYKKYQNDLWKSKNLYDCQFTDVYVNKPLETIGVK